MHRYKPLDEVLSQKKYKHIAIMILDGMGSHIINNNLADEAFIKNHKNVSKSVERYFVPLCLR